MGILRIRDPPGMGILRIGTTPPSPAQGGNLEFPREFFGNFFPKFPPRECPRTRTGNEGSPWKSLECHPWDEGFFFSENSRFFFFSPSLPNPRIFIPGFLFFFFMPWKKKFKKFLPLPIFLGTNIWDKAQELSLGLMGHRRWNSRGGKKIFKREWHSRGGKILGLEFQKGNKKRIGISKRKRKKGFEF